MKRILTNNIIYIANLVALGQWYDQVRRLFISSDFPQTLWKGLQEKLNMAVDERIERLGNLLQKIAEQEFEARDNRSASKSPQEGFNNCRLELKLYLEDNRKREGEQALRDPFLEIISKELDRKGKQYLTTIKGLSPKVSELGTRWLQGIVNEVTDGAFQLIPLLNSHS
jgi:UDP-N-acetylglucosamine/UDP-N-acetylgalactosamine diphosphorylase